MNTLLPSSIDSPNGLFDWSSLTVQCAQTVFCCFDLPSKQILASYLANIIAIRCNSVWRANQELVGIHNGAAHEELVKIYNRLTSWNPGSKMILVIKSIAFCENEM